MECCGVNDPSEWNTTYWYNEASAQLLFDLLYETSYVTRTPLFLFSFFWSNPIHLQRVKAVHILVCYIRGTQITKLLFYKHYLRITHRTDVPLACHYSQGVLLT